MTPEELKPELHSMTEDGTRTYTVHIPDTNNVWTITVRPRFPKVEPFDAEMGGYFSEAKLGKEEYVGIVHDAKGFPTPEAALEEAIRQIWKHEQAKRSKEND